jgi:hypothetical protein
MSGRVDVRGATSGLQHAELGLQLHYVPAERVECVSNLLLVEALLDDG